MSVRRSRAGPERGFSSRRRGWGGGARKEAPTNEGFWRLVDGCSFSDRSCLIASRKSPKPNKDAALSRKSLKLRAGFGELWTICDALAFQFSSSTKSTPTQPAPIRKGVEVSSSRVGCRREGGLDRISGRREEAKGKRDGDGSGHGRGPAGSREREREGKGWWRLETRIRGEADGDWRGDRQNHQIAIRQSL